MENIQYTPTVEFPKVHSLVPDVQFLAEFYKPHQVRLNRSEHYLISSPNQTHAAYEGVKRAGVEQTAHNLNGRSLFL